MSNTLSRRLETISSRPFQRTGIFIKCDTCAQEFYIQRNEIGKKRFCSKPCHNKAQISPLIPEEKFWNRVLKTDSCWLFVGHKNKKTGYGSFSRNKKDGTCLPHRFSWEITYGPIPPNLYVLHQCDNKICVKPEHLFLGTQRDNVRDAIKKGLFIFGPNRKLSAEQVRAIRPHKSTDAKKLAFFYGVSEGAIRGIISGRTWKGTRLSKGGEERTGDNFKKSV